MSATRGTDAVRVLRGVQIVLDEVIKAGEQNCKRTMKNCSIVTAVKDATVQFADGLGAAKLKVILYGILHDLFKYYMHIYIHYVKKYMLFKIILSE